jgi:hypothetical protein
MFWCSHFWELNDPMEGVYWFSEGTVTDDFIRKLYGEKAAHVLCSFSDKRAFKNPILWGYYANGFKGIAIEIEVDRARPNRDCDQSNIEKVKYEREIAHISNGDQTDEAVKRILMTKLYRWRHECEYRYLCRGTRGLHRIGEITAVYFGAPYQTTVNFPNIADHQQITEYAERAQILEQTAQQLPIPCYQVDIVAGRVQSTLMTPEDAEA